MYMYTHTHTHVYIYACMYVCIHTLTNTNTPHTPHTQELDEHQKETRGSFMVRVFGASGQPEIEVSRSLGWPNEETNEKLGFKCTYRGFSFSFFLKKKWTR